MSQAPPRLVEEDRYVGLLEVARDMTYVVPEGRVLYFLDVFLNDGSELYVDGEVRVIG